MADVVMYSSMWCPYCSMAKQLLGSKGVDFEEISVDFKSEVRQEMMQRANGRHTVPQIFIGDVHVGGFDDLHALERDGKLNPLLGIAD